MSPRRNSVGAAFLQGHSRADEAFYRAAAAHLYDIVTVTDRHGLITFMGGAVSSILGGRPHEHLARRLLDISHPDDRATLELHLTNLARSDPTDLVPPVEYRMLTTSGSYRWIESVTRNLLDDPAVNGLVLIGRDITSRKQAEAALRDSQIRLDTTMWATQIGFWELDLDTDETVWLNNWCDALRIDPCDGNDHVDRWDSRIHPDDLAAASGAFSGHIAGVNSYYEAEYRVLDRDGAWRWIRERGRVVERDDSGRARRMVGTCMDINMRRAAEDALRNCQAALQAMAASVPESLLQLDALLVVRSASRALGSMNPESLVGRPLGELVGHDERASLTQVLMGVLNDHRPAEFALRIGGASQLAMRARATPIVVANRATGLAVSVALPR
jgi:PAS domain S-box-containing protein